MRRLKLYSISTKASENVLKQIVHKVIDRPNQFGHGDRTSRRSFGRYWRGLWCRWQNSNLSRSLCCSYCGSHSCCWNRRGFNIAVHSIDSSNILLADSQTLAHRFAIQISQRNNCLTSINRKRSWTVMLMEEKSFQLSLRNHFFNLNDSPWQIHNLYKKIRKIE